MIFEATNVILVYVMWEIYLPVCDVNGLGSSQRTQTRFGETTDSDWHQLDRTQVGKGMTSIRIYTF